MHPLVYIAITATILIAFAVIIYLNYSETSGAQGSNAPVTNNDKNVPFSETNGEEADGTLVHEGPTCKNFGKGIVLMSPNMNGDKRVQMLKCNEQQQQKWKMHPNGEGKIKQNGEKMCHLYHDLYYCPVNMCYDDNVCTQSAGNA